MSSIYDTIAYCASAGDDDNIKYSSKVSKVDDYGRVSSVTLYLIFELPFVCVRLFVSFCVCICVCVIFLFGLLGEVDDCACVPL